MGGSLGTRRGTLLRGLILVLAAATTGMAHARLDTRTHQGPAELHVPEPRRAKLSALGFEPVLADFYWVRGLHLVGGWQGRQDYGDVVGKVVDLVTTLDPWVDHPYRFAAVWMTHDLDEVRRANALLRRGISYHPQDWRDRFHLAYNKFFYLLDNAGAAETLAPAIHMEGAPTYLGAFDVRLRADGGDLDTAAHFLEALIQDAPDEYARAEYLKAHDEIETERRARYLDRARVAFWERNGRDIRDPAELWSGPHRVIERAPPAHPNFRGFKWILDPKTNEIVSSFYRSRYRLHITESDAALRERWRKQLEAEQAKRGGNAG